MEYGMEFECLFGVSDGIQDITRRSGMVRRIRFIYRKSYSKFGNDPVHLWKVLESSRNIRNKSLWKVESRKDSTNPNQPTKWDGGVHGGLHLLGRPTHKEGGESPTSSPPLTRFDYLILWKDCTRTPRRSRFEPLGVPPI